MNTRKLIQALGSKAAHREAALVAIAMLATTAVYEYGSVWLVPDYQLNIWEFVGTWTGLICVWLSRTRNVLCWPWGIASSIALGFFFREIPLAGQEWLNWIYFTPIGVWGWYWWAFGGEARKELPVTKLSRSGQVLAVLAVTFGTAVAYAAIGFLSPGSHYPLLDALVVSASVVAQFLLGRKKVESWLLWLGPVNALSITLFFLAGAYTLTALYIAFFIHALFALISWRKAITLRSSIYV